MGEVSLSHSCGRESPPCSLSRQLAPQCSREHFYDSKSFSSRKYEGSGIVACISRLGLALLLGLLSGDVVGLWRKSRNGRDLRKAAREAETHNCSAGFQNNHLLTKHSVYLSPLMLFTSQILHSNETYKAYKARHFAACPATHISKCKRHIVNFRRFLVIGFNNSLLSGAPEIR
jgi:hypothetical protein